jgi:hypothetical protein
MFITVRTPSCKVVAVFLKVTLGERGCYIPTLLWPLSDVWLTVWSLVMSMYWSSPSVLVYIAVTILWQKWVDCHTDLSNLNWVHVLTCYFCVVHFNIILLLTPRSPKWSPFCGFLTNFVYISDPSYVMQYVLPILSPLICLHNIMWSIHVFKQSI